MNVTLEFSTAWILSYFLVLVRVTGFLIFIPIPGARRLLVPAKVILSLALTFLLTPFAWSPLDVRLLESPAVAWELAALILAETVFGLSIGAAIGLLLEAFGMAAQILGFQAGYSYINMVDPTTEVDASILNVLLALLGSLLFFSFDLHLHIVRALVDSFQEWPLGHFVTQPRDALMMVHLGGMVFQTAVRMALPIVAVLLLIDLTLALLNQVNSRLQLLTLAFPAKIIGAIALLYPLALLGPRVFYQLAEQTQQVITALVER